MIKDFRKLAALLLACTVLAGMLLQLPTPIGWTNAFAQDTRELQKEATATQAKKGPHPLTRLMQTANSRLRPELRGHHPRVYVTDSELEVLRHRARTTHRDVWQLALQQIRAIKVAPPPPPAEARRAQNEVGIGIAEAALAYKIEGDKKYLDAAKKYMDAAVSYDVWGYTYNKPNVDLAAGHLLYGLGWGYDLLYHDLTLAERQRYREKLSKQARLIFDRVLATYSDDGYYYEGFEYWIFSTPWLVHYLDAHAHATGEDLYERPGFQQMHEYVAHSMLPSGKYVFDFGDIFEGPLTRAGKGEEYPRTHPNGHFHTNYNLLYRIASRFRNSDAQGVADWLAALNQVNAEDYWSLIWYDSSLPATPMEKIPTWHYFRDHEVVYWRTNWNKDATAFAFKSGPPE